jgi:arabinogalactan oligomer/maltooligosaccharide transport system substrate-binding protein
MYPLIFPVTLIVVLRLASLQLGKNYCQRRQSYDIILQYQLEGWLLMKKIFFLLLCSFLPLVFLTTACGSQEVSPPKYEAETGTVDLIVWGAEEDEALLQEIFASFQSHYAGQANFQITFQPQSESSCKDALLGNLEEGADVFAFADDQVASLAAAGGLDPIADSAEIRGANLSAAVEAASVGGTLYAYPLTADNGYFLYYNKSYFSDKDIQSLERILELAAQAGRRVAMDWSSAWYVYSFFGNTGLTVGLNEDGLTNYCTWNSTEGGIRGVDVAKAMLSIAASPGFSNMTDQEFLAGVQNGSVIAGVSGVWNAVAIQEAWGEDAGAAKLPTYACAGKQVQMASFSGCKLIGVNAYSRYPEWAARLAEWITSEENQRLRFERRGQGPANINAANSPQVQSSPAIAALLAQSEFSQLQRVGGKFWDPVSEFALNMAAGNPSGASLQAQLDRLAEGVAAR